MTQRPGPIGFQSGNMATWHLSQYKLVVTGKGKAPELYDLTADRAESRNLADAEPRRVQAMRKQLVAWQKSCARSANGLDYSGPN